VGIHFVSRTCGLTHVVNPDVTPVRVPGGSSDSRNGDSAGNRDYGDECEESAQQTTSNKGHAFSSPLMARLWTDSIYFCTLSYASDEKCVNLSYMEGDKTAGSFSPNRVVRTMDG
jgi:hypothetical protein